MSVRWVHLHVSLFPGWIPVPEQSHRRMSIHQRKKKFKQREKWTTIWTHNYIKISWLRVNKFTALFNNKQTLKFNGQLIIIHFLLLSIIITIMIASNGPWNTQTHKMDRNPPISQSQILNFCFPRDPLRWLMAVKNGNFSCLLNFRVHVLLKCTVKL